MSETKETPIKQHTAKPFDYDGKYRGWECDCGFTSSTGHFKEDEAEIIKHITDETGFAWPTYGKKYTYHHE